MPSLSAFQNLQLTDQNSIDCWLLAHKFRHQTYAYAASLQGVSTPPYDFSGMPDDDWFNRHANAHQALQSFMTQNNSVSLAILTQYTWDDQDDFTTWMQMHTMIHQLLDESFELF
jgi:hypothetical protein